MLLNEHAGQPVRFILLGDFKGQLLAIQNSWRGRPVNNDFLRNSSQLRVLAGHNIITLTTCRRSDETLFSFYASLIEGGSREHATVQAAVADAMRTFPKKAREAEWNLSVTHAKRKRICKLINDQAAKGKTHVHVKASADLHSQDMFVFEGLVLVGCNQKKKGVVNGCFYKVLAVDEQQTTLLNLDTADAEMSAAQAAESDLEACSEDSDAETHATLESDITGATEATVTVATPDLSSCMRTYSACQSRTLSGRLRLHEVTHRHFTKRHLNVGLSRGTSCDLIDLCE